MLYVAFEPQPWSQVSVRYHYFDDVDESIKQKYPKLFEKPFRMISSYHAFGIPEIFLKRDDLFQYLDAMLKVYRQYYEDLPFFHHSYSRSKQRIIEKLAKVHPILTVAFFGVIEKIIQILNEEYDIPESHIKVNLSSHGLGILLSFPVDNELDEFSKNKFNIKLTYDAWIFLIHPETDLEQLKQLSVLLDKDDFEYAYVKVYSDRISHFSVIPMKNVVSFRNRFFHISVDKINLDKFYEFCDEYSVAYKTPYDWAYDNLQLEDINSINHSRFDESFSQFIFWRASKRLPEVLERLKI